MTVQVLGAPGSRNAVTTILLLDGSSFASNWDGRHEVAGLHSSDPVTIYFPGGRMHLPWHRIHSICHHDPEENDE